MNEKEARGWPQKSRLPEKPSGFYFPSFLQVKWWDLKPQSNDHFKCQN